MLQGSVSNTKTFPGSLEKMYTDEALLDVVQKQTFRYFWDFAHPHSGTIRERNHPSFADVVTTGGTGFGLMTIIVAVERKWISRNNAIGRIKNILQFLLTCETYSGAYAHWYHGKTKQTILFGKKDDGADLVETSFLIMGLLAVRQYFITDAEINDKVNAIWQKVNWQAFTRGKEVLYWHANNPGKKTINLKIEGYNEALITYILAAASPTHSIDKNVYDKGWARTGDISNGKSFYGHTLPLGPDYGGPLFFSHYSFMGLNPKGLRDRYADYWLQNQNHTLINYAYCIDNPKGYKGYSNECWGLSACDSGKRYKPHSPLKDNGTICPAAAISSMPYLPEASMGALKYFYTTMNDKLWGPYGFYDGFNKTRSWYANSYLAINQAPVIIMIENYRTGLLWDVCMSSPEIKNGLTKLNFENIS